MWLLISCLFSFTPGLLALFVPGHLMLFNQCDILMQLFTFDYCSGMFRNTQHSCSMERKLLKTEKNKEQNTYFSYFLKKTPNLVILT